MKHLLSIPTSTPLRNVDMERTIEQKFQNEINVECFYLWFYQGGGCGERERAGEELVCHTCMVLSTWGKCRVVKSSALSRRLGPDPEPSIEACPTTSNCNPFDLVRQAPSPPERWYSTSLALARSSQASWMQAWPPGVPRTEPLWVVSRCEKTGLMFSLMIGILLSLT